MKVGDYSLIEKLVDSAEYSFMHGIHTFVNPYSYQLLRERSDIYKEFTSVSIDGISLVKVINLVTGKSLIRKSFDMTSLAPVVFEDCISSNKKIAFIGSKKEDIKKFIAVILKSYPLLNICFYRDGYFLNEQERSQTIDSLIEIKPDYVIVGMGAVIQDNFLIDLKRKGWCGTGFTCGGFMHQTAKGLKYYPYLINKFNLRWLYRIYDEPKLLGRYFLDYPKSLAQVVADCRTYKK